MKISILIPCFNEAKFIEQCIDNIHKYSNVTNEKEIIVVDDCSTDGTRKIIEKLYNERKINDYVFKEFNEGKGAAIREGLNKVNGELVLIQDADLEYSPRDYGKLIAPFIYSNADVVYGSRYISTESKRVLLFWHGLANRILTLLCNMVTNLYLSDMETGYKLFKTKHIKNIKIEENRFGFEPEITIKLAKKKLKFYEVGISYNGRSYDEGKKIGIKDAFRAVYCIFYYFVK
tara:strand:- start:445 stop:1140 length:696 start_codon:yes stop_codon:yes gene_type:complete